MAPPNGLVGALTVQGQANLGVANYLPRVQPTEDRFQFADNVTWLKGAHNMKFGFDFAHTRDKLEALINSRGSYTYATFTNFALDLTNLDGGKRWQSYSQAFGDPELTVHVRDWNFFVQDQWRVTPKLTLNYGIRYEYAQYAQPQIFNPDYAQTARINQPKLNFAPRVGMAYSMGKSGKTVLRAGYGIFYARMPGASVANIHQSNGDLPEVDHLSEQQRCPIGRGTDFPRVSARDEPESHPPARLTSASPQADCSRRIRSSATSASNMRSPGILESR